MSEEKDQIEMEIAEAKVQSNASKKVEFKEETETIPATTKPKKEKKPRKPMSAEHKAKVIAGLAKAREKSAIARAKKKEVRKIKKIQADEEIDNIIREDLMKKTKKTDDKDKRIKELEEKLASLTLQDVIKPKKPSPKVLKTIDEVPEPPAQTGTTGTTQQAKQPTKAQAQVAAAKQPKVLAKVEPVIEKKEIKTAVYRGRKKRGR